MVFSSDITSEESDKFSKLNTFAFVIEDSFYFVTCNEISKPNHFLFTLAGFYLENFFFGGEALNMYGRGPLGARRKVDACTFEH